MVMRQRQEYETEVLPDQRRQEHERLARDRDLENAFSRWKNIANSYRSIVALLVGTNSVTFVAACTFAYLWLTVAPMPIVFHYNADGQITLAQVGWPQAKPTVLNTKAGLKNLFSRMREVLYDEYATRQNLEGVPPFLTARAQNMLAAFNEANPVKPFFERRLTRRISRFDAKQDPNTSFLYHVEWKEEIVDHLGRRTVEPVDVKAKVWTVDNATCPRTVEQAAANPNCIVVDSWEWNIMK